MFLKTTHLSCVLSGSALLVLSACGGGSDVSTPETPPTITTFTGKVTVDQAIKNAIVCMDLNANNACDTNEPTSAKTGVDGAYSLTYDPSTVTAAQVSSSSLISPMVSGAITDSTTTIDAADSTVANTTSAYILKQVPGKGGQINPLTTLVTVGMAQGMTEDVARANIATQLAITDTKIDNYQDDPAFDKAHIQDNARMMAKITAAALESGAALHVSDQTAAVSATAGNLASLRYADATNYFIRTLDSLAKPAGNSIRQIQDNRSGQTNGIATPENSLYKEAYLSSTGWVYCNANILQSGTSGNPSRSNYCNTQQLTGFNISLDIAGQPMAGVITAMQADPSTNTINNNGDSTTELMSKLGSATFPASALIQKRTSFNLGQAIYINNIRDDRLDESLTTLEQVIAKKPSSAVTLTTGGGTLGLGLGSGESKSLRVAFGASSSPTAGAVQFYECDLNTTQTAISNCIPTQTGTYAISTVNGVRVMRYSGHAETLMNHTRLHAEVKDVSGVASGQRVFQAREGKPTFAYSQSGSKRLNPTAWAAMRALLGL